MNTSLPFPPMNLPAPAGSTTLPSPPGRRDGDEGRDATTGSWQQFATRTPWRLSPAEEEKAGNAIPSPRITLDPENVKKGLGQLVLTVVELIRQLLEKQALRRIDSGSLTDQEVERLGLTFRGLNEQMEWLKQEFGLADEDLNLDLGPLGKLL